MPHNPNARTSTRERRRTEKHAFEIGRVVDLSESRHAARVELFRNPNSPQWHVVATSQTGDYALPNVGDVVIVLRGAAGRTAVIGSVYVDSEDIPDKDADSRVITHVAGHEIVMNEEEIRLEHESGNNLTIDDDGVKVNGDIVETE